MGIAGVAMVGVLFSLVMLAFHGIRYLYWKHTGSPAVGIFGELSSTFVDYKNEFSKEISRTYYAYAFTIVCDTQKHETTYTEEVSGSGLSKFKPGDRINLLWNASSKQYYQGDGVPKKLKDYLKMFIFSTALLLVCLILVAIL